MSTPSLLNIPYRLKAGTLYSQIPETGLGDFVVTRATTPTANLSTRVNSLGLIERVNDNVPRLDYPLGGAVNGCPALLVEPSATNLVLQSQDLTAGFWTPTTATINPNAATAPDGTLTADTLTATAINGQIQQVYVGTPGTTYTVSFYIKRRTGTGTVNIRAVENVNTPVTVTSNWTRVSFSATATSTTIRVGISLATSGDEVDLWGAQLETGSVPTSYIPTTTQAITRGADVPRKTGITSLIGQSEGAVYFEVEVTDEARNKWFCSLDSAAGSFIQMFITPTRTIAVQIQNNSSVVMTQLTSSALTVGYHKIAFAYNTATNGCIMYIDGVQNPVATRTVVAPGLPAFNNMSFGTYFSTTSDTLKAHVRAGAVYPNRLSNTELAALTTP